jgi:hypothetical protein
MKRLAPIILLVALTAACSSGDEAASTPAEQTSGAASTAAGTTSRGGAASGVDFPTGPAVLVAQGYTPLKDRIDNTGAYLPANGKPTLVFVEAIW